MVVVVVRWLVRGWLHCEDYSLFFHNIRENVALRCKAFERQVGLVASSCVSRCLLAHTELITCFGTGRELKHSRKVL